MLEVARGVNGVLDRGPRAQSSWINLRNARDRCVKAMVRHTQGRPIWDSHKWIKLGGTVMKFGANLLLIAAPFSAALLLGGCVLTGHGYWTPSDYAPSESYYRPSSPDNWPYRSPQFQRYYRPQIGPQIGPQYHSQPYYYRPHHGAPHETRRGASSTNTGSSKKPTRGRH